ncbi:NifU N-terminal domain-containing protein [Virgibacillus sp. FSP13]
MGLRAEATPNPNALKFSTDKLIFEGTASISVMPGDTSEHAILNDLMQLEGVDNVFGYQNFITVNKQFDVEWDDLQPKVENVFEKHGYSN